MMLEYQRINQNSEEKNMYLNNIKFKNKKK